VARISFVNGQYLETSKAMVNIEDRGYQFADSVYEVVYFRNKQLVEGDSHFARLEKSLEKTFIPLPMPVRIIKLHAYQLMALNHCFEGLLYIQVTRGVAKRQHHFPKKILPQLILTLYPCCSQIQLQGVSIITIPDLRWKGCDIKSTSLLPNVMGKQKARENDAFEAWLVDQNGFITEGTSTNAWIVRDHKLVTTPEGSILSGIRRSRIKSLAKDLNITVEERPFHESELFQAEEAFLTSTCIPGGILPVINANKQPIGTGTIGPLSLRLGAAYEAFLKIQTKAI
jgi:D-alanine transaminase